MRNNGEDTCHTANNNMRLNKGRLNLNNLAEPSAAVACLGDSKQDKKNAIHKHTRSISIHCASIDLVS